jgi:LmbE family N-acetylglucosaminyl deacetylase
MFKLKKVFFFGAHPDDVELGASGLMMRLIDKNIAIKSIVFSNCEEQPGNEGITEEWKNSMKKLGVKDCKMYEFPNTRLPKHSDDIREILEKLKREKPSLIVTHSLHTIHQDHKTISTECERVFRNTSMICFEDVKSTPNFYPKLFVELTSEEVKRKIDLLMGFKTQLRRYYHKPEIIRSLLIYRGAQVGVKYAEAFEVVRLVFLTL